MNIFFLGKRNKEIKAAFIKEISKIEDILKKDKENYVAVLLKTSNAEILRRMIDKASHYFEVYVLGMTDKINRAALEHKKVKALVSPEHSREYDYKDYRNSGLNQVLCKIARDNNKLIIENFTEFLKMEKKAKALLLGRIMQNARLCKKYDVKFSIAQFIRSEKEAVSDEKIKEFERIL